MSDNLIYIETSAACFDKQLNRAAHALGMELLEGVES